MVENFNRQGREFFRDFAYGWMENMSDLLFRLLGVEFLNGAREGVEPEVGCVALVEKGTAQEFHIAELACGKLGGDECL